MYYDLWKPLIAKDADAGASAIANFLIFEQNVKILGRDESRNEKQTTPPLNI